MIFPCFGEPRELFWRLRFQDPAYRLEPGSSKPMANASEKNPSFRRELEKSLSLLEQDILSGQIHSINIAD